jgi:valyl-tRNA synthetase
MKHRFRSWVEGLNIDWNISRQRFFGVPFPVWYPVDAHGEINFDAPILATIDQLPIDPSTDVPAGFTEDQRGAANGFVGDPDVMDTWATSSLTPQIAGKWGTDLFERVFPMDLRPQAHEIIRTWLFSTVVRSHFGFGSLPFTNTLISGWVLDPDRKKMSKSVGNVVTPMPLIDLHGADALRYWAASGRPGTDTAIDEAQMKVGRRLAIKLLNASKFVLGVLGEDALYDPSFITEEIDRDLITTLRKVVEEAGHAYDTYDYARALERIEQFFWQFCDDYVELVKIRAYRDVSSAETRSALATLALALSVLQRLLAPTLPFATEEVWSWWQTGSVHGAPWPTLSELDAVPISTQRSLDTVGQVLEAIRREKSLAKVGQKAKVASCTVFGSKDFIAASQIGEGELRDAGSVLRFDYQLASDVSIVVVLAPTEEA